MKCPVCSTQLDENARFCGACGTRLQGPPSSGGTPVAPQSGSGSGPVGVGVNVGAQRARNQEALMKTMMPDSRSPLVVPPAPPAGPAGQNLAMAQTLLPTAPPPGANAFAGVRPGSAPAPQGSSPQPAPMRAPTAPPVPGDPYIGTTLNNRYLVEAKLGVGGFGAVYRGKQLAIGREVALKLLHPEMARDSNLVARFRREGAVACNLRDAHTITTYDFDQTADGTLYIAMELLRGISLQEVFNREAPISWQRMFHILEQMCSSLAEAHTQGIIHRDLKPENIYLENRAGEPDFVKVLDFGIAKIVGGEMGSQSAQLTATGQTLGTLEYMSPEQLMGRDLRGTSDVYALGVLAYELITGQLPFPEAKGPAELIGAQLKKTPPPPSTVRPDRAIPAVVDQIVLKMLAKDPAKRYQSVNELRTALQQAVQGANTHDEASLASTLPSPIRSPLADAPGGAQGANPGQAPLFQPSGPPPQPVGPPVVAGGQVAPGAGAGTSVADAGGGRWWLWVLLGALVAGGGAVAVYMTMFR